MEGEKKGKGKKKEGKERRERKRNINAIKLRTKRVLEGYLGYVQLAKTRKL